MVKRDLTCAEPGKPVLNVKAHTDFTTKVGTCWSKTKTPSINKARRLTAEENAEGGLYAPACHVQLRYREGDENTPFSVGTVTASCPAAARSHRPDPPRPPPRPHPGAGICPAPAALGGSR